MIAEGCRNLAPTPTLPGVSTQDSATMASARKRHRAEPEDNRAECPFTVKNVDPKDKERKKKKRGRTENVEESTAQRINQQMSLFKPCGKFKTHKAMDLYYQVDPAKRWTDMTRYNSFVRKFNPRHLPYALD
jgi:hypothetical protein